jgi:hypothetical protein
MSSAYQIAQTLLRQTRDYGQVQLGVVICLGILLFATAIMRRKGSKEDSVPREGITAPAWLLLYASATMLLLFVAAYSIGGSDRRRSLVALALLVLSVIVIAASRSRLVLAAIVSYCRAVYCDRQRACWRSCLGGSERIRNSITSPRSRWEYRGSACTGKVRATRKQRSGIYPGSFSPADRIYEPNALKLALLQENTVLTLDTSGIRALR